MPLVQMWVEAPDVKFPPPNLPETDGVPLESPWHQAAISLLIDSVHSCMGERADYFVGGNLFLYYSWEESKKQDYKGPDFLFVGGVDRKKPRNYWATWEEGGKYPDVLMELLSPTTAVEDRTTKKTLYEQNFRTPEYFWYDPATRELKGWRLKGNHGYEEIPPNDRGWLWSEQLGMYLGLWEGEYLGLKAIWPRFYDKQGQLVLLNSEKEKLLADQERLRAEQEHQRAEQEHQRAEQQRQRAEEERQRAEAAEAEVVRLKALLAEKGIAPPSS